MAAESAPQGFVYFVQPCGGGPVKIGTALDPRARLAELQTGSPLPLRVIALLPGGRIEERALRVRFKKAHYQGEWFWPVQKIADFLARKCRTQTDLIVCDFPASDQAAPTCMHCGRPPIEVGANLHGACFQCARRIFKRHDRLLARLGCWPPQLASTRRSDHADARVSYQNCARCNRRVYGDFQTHWTFCPKTPLEEECPDLFFTPKPTPFPHESDLRQLSDERMRKKLGMPHRARPAIPPEATS